MGGPAQRSLKEKGGSERRRAFTTPEGAVLGLQREPGPPLSHERGRVLPSASQQGVSVMYAGEAARAGSGRRHQAAMGAGDDRATG